MKTLRRKVVALIALTLVSSCTIIGLSACSCGDKKKKHTHEYGTTWSTDENEHWLNCTGSKCEEVSEKAAHVYDNDADTTCNTCGYERAAHTCVAGATWEKDETEHWHVCTVEGCTEKLDAAAHVYDQEVVDEAYLESEANYTTPALYYKSCVCGAKGAETFEHGTKLDAKANAVALAEGVTLGKTFDGAAYSVSAEQFAYSGDGAVSYQWFKGEETLTEAPTNAGDYKVKVSVAATAEWLAAENTFDFTIARRAVEVPVLPQSQFVYDGTEKSVSVPESPYYKFEDEHTTLSATNVFYADEEYYEYEVTLNIDVENCYWVGKSDTEIMVILYWEILPAPVAEPTITGTYIYNNTKQTANIAASSLYTVTNNEREDAGSQQVTVSLNDKDNYIWATNENTTDLSLTFTVEKKPLTATIENADDFANNFTTGMLLPSPYVRTNIIAGSDGYGSQTSAWEKWNETDWETVERSVMQSNAGKYRVTVTYPEGRNYTAASATPVEFEVIAPSYAFVDTEIATTAAGTTYYEFQPANYGLYELAIEGATITVYREIHQAMGELLEVVEGVTDELYVFDKYDSTDYQTRVIIKVTSATAISNKVLVSAYAATTSKTLTLDGVANTFDANNSTENKCYKVTFGIEDPEEYTLTFTSGMTIICQNSSVYPNDFNNVLLTSGVVLDAAGDQYSSYTFFVIVPAGMENPAITLTAVA